MPTLTSRLARLTLTVTAVVALVAGGALPATAAGSTPVPPTQQPTGWWCRVTHLC